MDPDRGATVAWLRVWTRAVVGPAWRRAAAVWAGTFIVGGIVFGPRGLIVVGVGDATILASHDAGWLDALSARRVELAPSAAPTA